MADFIDSEAEESEDEELDIKDKKKLKRLKQFEDDDEEEEEDDEEKIREELRDLIDDGPLDEEEESGGSSSSEEEGDGGTGGGSEKRKKSDEEEFDDRLEDEDYDLLEENLGHKVERRKRFKRLRRIEDEESEAEGGDGEEEERDAIANELFEGSDHEEDVGSTRHSIQDRYDVGDEGEEEYSDADDFIVDDEGRPIAEKRKKRQFFSDSTLQEAQEIFGVDFDYDDFEKYGEDEYEEEEDEEDEYLDDEDDGKRRKPKKPTAKKATKKSIFEIYEPSELKRGHFTDFDIKIRTTDIPERMQLRDIPITSVADGSDELDEEADWIYRHAFCKPTLSSQEWSDNTERGRPKKDPKTIGKIKKALEFMRNQHFEVPFISFYRKEYVLPELSIHDLWRVYKFDAKWCQLHTRKTTLLNLMEKMKNFQQELLTKDINAPIPEHVRILTDEDVDRLKNVQSTEELRDVHNHFLLYYSHDVKVMQDALRIKRKEAAKNKIKQIKINEDGEEVEEEEEEVVEKEELGKEVDPQEIQVKKGSRSGSYALCVRARLGGLAKRFGLKPDEFAENLRDNYQRHEVDQEGGTPAEIAKEYISPKFPTAEDVIKGAKFVVATQLAREPLVRSCLRDIFQDRANISVHPTKKGQKEVDENHPCWSMKYMKDKSVKDLKNDQYLKLYLAHEDKLLDVTISHEISGLTASSYIDEIKQLYYRDEFMHHVQEWNTVRSECVELAIKTMLLPELSKELHARLIEESKEFIAKACARKLYNWIKVAPFSVDFGDDDDDEWDTSKGLRIMGLSYVPDLSQSAFCCMIAPDGECTDHLRLPHLLKRKNSYREEEKMLKEADLSALKNFILTKKPHAIAVGGESRETLMITADLKQIISTLVEDEQFPQIPVEIVDNDFAKIYANSLKGESDFRDYPLLLRQSISVARRLQDPLVEFSQLCTHDDEILCLRYHPLQEQLPKDELLDIITTEFVNRVNEVGVDINEVVLNNYCTNLVQYVCGLGPRKGTMLIKLLKQTNQRLENRTQLVTSCHMGPKVFINCAGFIKIDTNALGDSTEAYVEVLDGSRVHPETYEWARKMAVDALEYDDEDPNPAGALEEILDKPEKLKDLDLDAFAEELERQSFGNKSITLYDIRSELSHRYKDLRVPYQSPGPELIFDILTKETPETFYVGKLVTATVIGISHKKPEKDQLDHANPVRNDETGLWQCPFCLKNDFPELSEVWNHFDAGGCPGQATGVRIRLDNGVSGYIHIKNLSDSRVTDPTQRVQRGQLVHARIIKIDVERFSVEATCKSSDLIDKNNDWRPPKDTYYDHDAEAKDLQTEEEMKKMKQRQTYIKRVIVHPCFHNISFGEAEKLMAHMEQGEVVIRPSSKGADHLTVTWKVADNIYQHIDVREEGKENAFSLGQSLWIGNEEFEDLDEIIARYVNPMASYVRDMFSFRYYKDTEGGLKDKAEEMLKEEKKKNPAKIHYIISVVKNYPGKFLLSYLPITRCRHEYVSITSTGFRFRGKVFDSVNSLFRWFKEHFRDPVPGTPSTPRTQPVNASVRTTFTTPGYTNPMPMTGMPAEAIHRVAQNMPNHMMHTLSQVASHTPHYAHTPAAFSTASSYFPNTPYTPSGQTPFMTPYATTPRYQGGMTPGGISLAPSPAQQSTSSGGGGGSGNGVFLHPGAVTPRQTPRYDSRNTPGYEPRATPGYEPRSTPAYEPRSTPGYEGRNTPAYEPRSTPRAEGRSTPAYQRGGVAAEDWRRAAEEWAKKQSRGTPRNANATSNPNSYNDVNSPYNSSPRVPSWKGTPQPHNQHPFSESPYDPGDVSPASIPSKYDPFEKSPRYPGTPRSAARSTPGTINSPHSMSLGDSTPLYDETI